MTFAYDGVTYEIDLSSKNKDKLGKALQPFIDAARKVGGRRSSGGTRGKSSNLAAIRAWAKDNNHKVSERGRIPAAVIAAYEAAH